MAFHAAAKAIMTTDTFIKVATATCQNRQVVKVTSCAIAKGAGMIAPDMATMLLLYLHRLGHQRAGTAGAAPGWRRRDTFNAVTIDGDTSTSDTLMMVAAGGASGLAPRIARASDPRLKAYKKGVAGRARRSLRRKVARDGEGARKLVEIVVEGAVSAPSAARDCSCRRSPGRRW